MATTLASQLETIRSFAKADSEPLKRPFTRPSILFDPKEAADIDIEALFSIALEGLEILIGKDERFRNYKNDLFSHRSKELDRELMGIEQNNQLNVSIASYLRLLSGYFLLRPALTTLEYLIRRHKIHVYNNEDLILCSLPYHDTHPFVRIVQILDTRNTKWGFLDGVKASGAPPPRMVIVQQCIRDKGILDALCNYASPPSKKSQPSKLFIAFCTAVFVEVLGTVVTVNDDLVKRILPFVVSGLQSGSNGVSDHKAGSLMIIGLLGNKAALAPKLLNSLIRSVAEVARGEAIEMTDIYWFRLSLITLINLVQSQNVEILPTKALEILNKIRDMAGVLLELSKEFNIERFLRVLLDSLIDCSSDENCQRTLLSLIEIVPINSFVYHVVTVILSTCVKLSQKVGDSTSSMSAGWAKKILITLNTKYPSELRGAVHHFLQENKAHSKKGDSLYKILCKLLDGNLDSGLNILDTKVWFGLYHPKADVRRATLLELDYSVILKTKAVGSENLINIQEAILKLLDDKELTVVQAALCVDGLPNVIDSCKLLDALLNVLRRCMDKLLSGYDDIDSLNGEVAVTCLKKAISFFNDHTDYLKNVAAMIFPLLLVLPQTQNLSVKALGLVNKINWPLYKNISTALSGEGASIPGSLSSINLTIVNKMAENFLVHPEEHVIWFLECCSDLELSKTLFLFVVLQSLCIKPKDEEDICALFECLFPILKAQWETSVTADVELDEFNSEMLEWEYKDFLKHLLYANLRPINVKVMICIFWRLLELLLSVTPSDILNDGDKWVSKTRDLFVFFVSSKLKHAFRKHLNHLALQCRISPSCLFSKFFTEEGVPAAIQVESLQCHAFLCSLGPDRWKLGLLAEFPSVLVPLASDNQNIRVAAMDCIDSLHTLWCHFEHAGKKNGNNASWFHLVGELLSLMSQLKTFILSDKKFLPSLFASTLSSSSPNSLEHKNILVPQNVEKRFDQPTKIKIIGFILGSTLKLSNYGKLMVLSLFRGIGNALMHVPEVGSLLLTFLKQYYEKLSLSCPNLSDNEIQITCLLLESCVMSSPSGGKDLQDLLLKVLRFGGLNMDDPACVKPCITVLNKLNNKFYVELKNEVKEHLFCELVFLWRNDNGDVQRATKEAVMRIDINFSTVGYMLDLILAPKSFIVSSSNEKVVKKQKLFGHQKAEDPSNNICRRDNPVYILSSLLDVLLLKKDITNRHLLIGPLFKLLSKVFSEECMNESFIPVRRLSQQSSPSEANNSTIYHIQQTLLIILEDIIISLKSFAPPNEMIKSEINIKLLIECAQNSNVVITRNHVFSVLSAITRVCQEQVLEYMLDILVVIGEAAVTQIDDHSRIVFEDLISAIVPCWLSKTDDMEKLLKVFMEIFPEIVEHRRLSFVLYLLRTLGEGKSLASLLILLFHSLISKKASSFLNVETADDLSFYTGEWEYKFAVQICEQFTSMIWLPSLVMLLEQIGNRDGDQTQFLELFIVMQFSLQKLQDPEFVFKLESREDAAVIQRALGELMEQVVLLLQLVDARKKQLNMPVIMRKELKETMRAVIRNLTAVMIPYVYFNSIIKLLHNADKNVGKKALGLLCEAGRSHKNVSLKLKDNKGSRSTPSSLLLHMNETSQESLNKLCVEIIRVLDDSSDTSLKMAAISALEVVAEIFPSNNSIHSQAEISTQLCFLKLFVFLIIVHSQVEMAAAPAATFTIGSTASLGQRGSSLPQSRSFGLKFNSQNPLKSFCGLKAMSSVRCESELSFLGNKSGSALRASFASKAQKENSQKFNYQLQPQASYKVAVLGAAGGIGQPLSLLIKMSPLVSDLHLYDIANVKGVAADISHCNTPSQVKDFTGASELANCLNGVNVVVIPAGVPRKPGMTRDDLFNINAGIVRDLVSAVADNCPGAFILIISNPVNSTVPIAAEVLKQKGVYDPKKLFGVTTLDVVRANTFVAQRKNLKLIDVDVPVVGGHAGITILPLLSKTRPSASFTDEEVEELTVRIQNAGTEVVEAKAGAGSATLSMAYAAARFVESSLRALDGDGDVYECSFVQSDLTDLPFFASRVKLGKKGIEALIPSDLQGLTDYEQKALEALKPELKSSIEKGIAFAQKQAVAA